MTDWQPIQSAPENEVVMTKLHDDYGPRNEQPLKKQGNLWFIPDGSLYIYYTPTHWKPAKVVSEKVVTTVVKEYVSA